MSPTGWGTGKPQRRFFSRRPEESNPSSRDHVQDERLSGARVVYQDGRLFARAERLFVYHHHSVLPEASRRRRGHSWRREGPAVVGPDRPCERDFRSAHQTTTPFQTRGTSLLFGGVVARAGETPHRAYRLVLLETPICLETTAS